MTSGGGRSGSRIVIVRKKKAGDHDTSHGGSWKVAYADFVTAMMAFFLVMWIMTMDQGVKDLVQGYFQNPVGFKRTFSGGTNPLAAGNSPTNLQIKRTVILNHNQQERRFEKAAKEIRQRIDQERLLSGLKASVEIVVTDEGLRIEMMETGTGPVFFDKASARLKPALERVLDVVGSVLTDLPGSVVVEGHTDALPFGGKGYSNWELSVDRANAARRELVASGFDPSRLTEVRGYADRQLKVPGDPLDPRNRRISILLPYQEIPLDSLKLIPGIEPVRTTERVLGLPGTGG
jgi:chemotaxis protein MotB